MMILFTSRKDKLAFTEFLAYDAVSCLKLGVLIMIMLKPEDRNSSNFRTLIPCCLLGSPRLRHEEVKDRQRK
jgi:hypothetical protein